MSYDLDDFKKDFMRLLNIQGEMPGQSLKQSPFDYNRFSKAQKEMSEYDSFVSCLEYIAADMLEGIHKPGTWYDGVTANVFSKANSQQIEIKGTITVVNRDDWSEKPFLALITNRSSTDEGIWLRICVGEFEVEGELNDMWGCHFHQPTITQLRPEQVAEAKYVNYTAANLVDSKNSFCIL